MYGVFGSTMARPLAIRHRLGRKSGGSGDGGRRRQIRDSQTLVTEPKSWFVSGGPRERRARRAAGALGGEREPLDSDDVAAIGI